MKTNIGGIILCGGKSSRFGSNKGLYSFKSKELLKYPIELLQHFTSDIIVAGPEIIQYEGISFVKDIYPEMGPMGGIHAGLHYSKHETNIILACDTPFINTVIIENLCTNIHNADIIITKTSDNKYHPLTGIYTKRCLEPLEENLKQNNRKLIKFVMDQNHKVLEIEDKNSNKLFSNFNYLEDAQKHENEEL